MSAGLEGNKVWQFLAAVCAINPLSLLRLRPQDEDAERVDCIQSIEKFFRETKSSSFLTRWYWYLPGNLFSTAATLYFIYTALLATYFICLIKFMRPRGFSLRACL